MRCSSRRASRCGRRSPTRRCRHRLGAAGRARRPGTDPGRISTGSSTACTPDRSPHAACSYDRRIADANPRGVDVVVPDRAELLLVFGQIAPARRRGAEPGAHVPDRDGVHRRRSRVDRRQQRRRRLRRDQRLLFVQANVVSVVTRSGEVPEITQPSSPIRHASTSSRRTIRSSSARSRSTPATERIAGVDVVVVLGRSYLDKYGAEPATGHRR